MYLEIVSPEAILFSSEVDSVVVPGVNGEFEMLNNHASTIAVLQQGTIRIKTHTQNQVDLDKLHDSIIQHPSDNKVLTLKINSGTVEMNNNKIIVLAD